MMLAVAEMESEKARLGCIMTSEMGKPLKAAADEATECAWCCRGTTQKTPSGSFSRWLRKRTFGTWLWCKRVGGGR
jgi:acyl-CoA reductase-like NAD-dependent aldehyde dehydrogenase